MIPVDWVEAAPPRALVQVAQVGAAGPLVLVEAQGERVPVLVEVVGERVPVLVEVVEERALARVEVVGERVPVLVEVVGERALAQVEAAVARVPVLVEVVGERALAQVEAAVARVPVLALVARSRVEWVAALQADPVSPGFGLAEQWPTVPSGPWESPSLESSPQLIAAIAAWLRTEAL